MNYWRDEFEAMYPPAVDWHNVPIDDIGEVPEKDFPKRPWAPGDHIYGLGAIVAVGETIVEIDDTVSTTPPAGFQTYIEGSYYKKGIHGLIFRWDGEEWRRSAKTEREISEEMELQAIEIARLDAERAVEAREREDFFKWFFPGG